MQRLLLSLSLISPLLMCSTVARAEGFGINATRLIYPQGESSIMVSVRNTTTKQPFLVQASVSHLKDKNQPAPFYVRPPLFRMEPGGVNQIRIVAQGINAPSDRESVFYFHASAIPASTAPVVGERNFGIYGTVQFGVSNIIKLFYRPSGLPSSSLAAQEGLQFSLVQGGLEVSNPSPYFVSFATLRVAGKAFKLDTPGALMLAPFSEHTYQTTATRGTVEWQTINDEGGINAFSYVLP
ncbi:pilus assembly protein PapD [Chania multitudinisentens RB-25]|uniref:Pilus assembly protein PapD n=1 Tax=Chania multitudinisentens RB-25 TaxID=1441930 RepID=W0L3X3_9GAMM|nr:molecular chaperone [Chania multitudinisentens]AHG18376.1 pilus assembly protein PapD [Chania multitudinisentens RB-25]